MDVATVLAAVASLDWEQQRPCGVTISRTRDDWADGSGSLHSDVGLALMVEQRGVQHVANSAPQSLDDITQFLLAYLREDDARVFEALYDRPPTDEELERFLQPPLPELVLPKLSPRGCFYVAFGSFVLLILVGALLARLGAR